MWAQRLNAHPKKLREYLWGDFAFNTKDKKVRVLWACACVCERVGCPEEVWADDMIRWTSEGVSGRGGGW